MGSVNTTKGVRWLTLSRTEWEAIALALIIAHAFFARGLVFPSAYDALQYRIVATDIARVGLFGAFEFQEIRTYGYPLFLLGMKTVADFIGVAWPLAVFEVQLAAYIAAALFVRATIAVAFEALARLVGIALLLNPFALLYVTDTLTEAPSLVLILIVAASWIRMFLSTRFAWSALVIGSLAAGTAVIVRPANLFALIAWVLGIAILLWMRPRGGVRKSAAAGCLIVLLAALPMLPQLINNVRQHDMWTPLVAADLGNFQNYAGVKLIKYATGLPPISTAQIRYENPYLRDRPVDVKQPLRWYVQHPGAGFATLGLHVFGMLDQDLLFTYARDLDPWYRRPLGVLTHGAIGLSLLGLGLLGLRARADRTTKAVFLTLVAFVTSHLALHATSAVEMRFGLPLLVLAGPLAAWFVQQSWPSGGISRRAAIAGFTATWIVASLMLSDWMREQVAQIRGGPQAVQGMPAAQ